MCLEEIALEQGWVSPDAVVARADRMGATDYAAYLRRRAREIASA